jgi:hypothetical protein
MTNLTIVDKIRLAIATGLGFVGAFGFAFGGAGLAYAWLTGHRTPFTAVRCSLRLLDHCSLRVSCCLFSRLSCGRGGDAVQGQPPNKRWSARDHGVRSLSAIR